VDDDSAPAPRAARPPPTAGRPDELLVEPPEIPEGGSLAGYRAGRRVRLAFAAIAILTIGAGIWLWRWLDARREAAENAPIVPSYTVTGDDLESRPRQFVWSSGPARLGLTREPPGIEEIVLPDRRLRLADGCDHAQVKVDVQGDRTLSLTVLTGDIIQLPPAAAPGSPPGPAATGP